MRGLAGLALAAAALIISACDAPVWRSVLADARERGALRVATINAPTAYYEGRDGEAGYEYDLVTSFADHLGLDVEMLVAPDIPGVLAMVEAGKADIGAAGLVITTDRDRRHEFSPPYRFISEVIVCRRGRQARAARRDLPAADIAVPAGSSHAQRLEKLEDHGVLLSFRLDGADKGQDMLAAVAEGAVPCTVADSHVYALNRRYYRGLEAVETLPGQRAVGWALAGGEGLRGAELAREVEDFFAARTTQERVIALNEKYFGFGPEDVDPNHAAAFLAAIETRLPKWKELFQEAGAKHGVPWTLLAAVAYQESHWNPDAVSPTGVRGMLMLTRATAKHLGVADRTDARQSTFGGAKYLVQLRNKLPATIPADDRWWFAAASYNMGYGHVLDARALARERGLDADRWADVRDMLPLIEDPAVYKDLRHGFGHGRQARSYVMRVRDFADILEKRFHAPLRPDSALTADAAPADGVGEG